MMAILLTLMILQIPDARPFRVPSRVVVSGPRVTLADLGWPDRILGDVPLMDAPSPGRRIRVYRRNMLKILRNNAPGIRFVVPRRVTIVRSRQVVEGDRLRSLVAKALHGRLPKGAKILSLYLGRRRATLPKGTVTVRIVDSGTWHRLGSFVGRAVLECSGYTMEFGISARYALVREVAVLSHAMRAGTPVTSRDVMFRSMDVTRLPGAITSESFREGMILKTSMGRGRPLTSRMVRKPRIVHRGSRVLMIAHIGRVEVSTWGIARTDGAEGDRVVVTNPRTGKVLKATVTGPGRVVVINR